MGESKFSLIVISMFRSRILAIFLSVLCVAVTAAAQAANKSATIQAVNVKTEAPAKRAGSGAAFAEYRKVVIGTEASAIKEMWGDPKIEDADGFLYELSESEMAQIVIGPDKKVKAISITYADGKGAPAFGEVFGDGVKPEKKENGTVYRMVRYPEAGYWVSYYAGSGDKPSVTVTIQKL